MATISFKNLNKIYDNNVQAVFDFNLEVQDKEFIVLVGPSGCGKSTTLRMLAGLEDITSGEIYIDNTLINDVAPKNRNISMVFQNYALYPHMSVFENMAFSLKLRKAMFPLYELDTKNPNYIKESNELYSSNKLETKTGIIDLKKTCTKRGKKNLSATIKEYKFKQANKLTLALNELKGKYSKRVMTFDHDKLNALEKELNELEKDIINNASLIEEKKTEIEKVRNDNNCPAYEYRQYTKEEITDKVIRAAETLGLAPYLKRRPAALSGGQRQRVALGRAIVRNPKVFLMDEPLSNLDAKLRVQMRSEIIKIHQQVGATTVYVTHDQTEAMTMASRIVCMKDGYIQQIGTPKELYNKPSNMFVAGFIGAPAMNFIHGCYDGESFKANDSDVSIKLSKDQNEALQAYKNKEVILGIRPEEIGLKGDVTIVNPSSSISLECDISELLGKELIVYTNIGKDRLIIKTTSRDDIVGGSKEEYVLNMDKVLFFDPVTTNRI